MSKVGLPYLASSLVTWPVLSMPWAIAGVGTEQQFSSTAGKYAAEGMHFKTVTAMTNEATFSRFFISAFKAAFEAGGGKVIQEQYTTTPATDYAPYLANLKQADAVAAWFNGSDAILFLTQMQQFGIRKKMPVYCAFFGGFESIYLLNAMPKDAADACIGDVMASPYSPLLDTDINKNFVAKFKQKFGETPQDEVTHPYDAGNILLHALQATGGDTTPDKLREAILNVNFQGVQSRVHFDHANKCRIRDIYICKTDKVNGEYAWVPFYTYKDVPPAGFAPPPTS